MSVTTQQVVVEFIADTKSLKPGIDQLAETGAVEKQVADQFKNTNTQIQRQQQIIAATGKATDDALNKNKKTIDDLDKATKNYANDFVAGFQEGVIEALNDAGVSAEEFQAALKGVGIETGNVDQATEGLSERLALLKQRLSSVERDGAFTALQGRVNDARKALFDTAAELEHLASSGGTGTERFENLTAALITQQDALAKVEAEYGAVIDRAEGLKKANDDLAASTSTVTKQQEEMAAKLAALKARLSALPQDDAFGQLEKKVSSTRREILNTSAALEQLARTGGGGSERIKDLTELLALQQAELEKLEEQYTSVSSVLDKINPEPLNDGLNTLKKELAEITGRLIQMKAAGDDGTKEFADLTTRAGLLRKAIADVGKEVRASAVEPLEGIIAVAGGVAGAFSTIAGAEALFGNNAGELQEVLVKVNGALALAQGLEQTLTLVKKESAAATFLQTIGTKAQTAAQVLFNFVVGTSTGLLRVFKIALATTGIGLLILALVEGIALLKRFATATADAAEEQKKLNEAIAKTNESLINSNNLYVQFISERKKDLEDELALAEARGDSELKLLAIRKQIAQEEAVIAQKSLDNLGLSRNRIDQLGAQYASILNKLTALNSVAQNDLSAGNQKAAETLRGRLQAQADAIKPLLDAGTAALEQLDKANQAVAVNDIQRQKALREARNKTLQDQLAALERNLLIAQREGTATLAIEQAIVRKKAEIDLNAEKLTANQRKLIQERAFTDQLTLSKENAKKISDEAINNLIATNNAQLANIKTTDEERKRLTIENIINTAQLEVNAAEKNASKIKEINAKRDADIKEVRLKFINDAVEYEIALETAKNGAVDRLNRKIVDDEKRKNIERFRALNDLNSHELDNIHKRMDALNASFRQGLISEKDYNLQYAQLQDEQTKILEGAEDDRQKIIADGKKKQIESLKGAIDISLQFAQAGLDILAMVNDNTAAKENERLAAERDRVKELRESGAITEKEAIARNRRLDAEEKKIRYQQAVREKQVALFQAIINTAAGIAKAIPNPFLMALAAAVGGAQIALIASRPVPKFGKGKKNKYEGPAEVGETGAELIEKDGRMFIAKKRTFMWLGKDDKVYNPQETAAMINGRDMHPISATGIVTNNYSTGMTIDYERLGESVGKNIPKYGMQIDSRGFTEYVDKHRSFDAYLRSRRNYK